MSTTTPAGWYPDPKPLDPAHPGQRWWNGSEWTVSTRTDDVLSSAPARRPRSRPRRATVVAGTVAALLGLGVGSLTTYLIMHGNNSTTSASAPAQRFGSGTAPGGGGSGGEGGSGGAGGSQGGSGGLLPGLPGTGGSSGGGASGGTGGGSGGLPGGTDSTTAVDVIDGVSLPIPSGWTGGTDDDGYAGLTIGSYTCPQSSGGTCSLGGANTETLKASVSAGAQAAAEADIANAAKEAYGTITGHTQLEAQSVNVAGRSGYLIRWKVDAKVGNDGTVETVVFPTSDGKSLVALHMGFDTAAKAPAVSVMDTIVSGVKDVDTSGLTGSGTGGASGSNS